MSDKVREQIDKLYAEAQKNYYAYCEQKNGLAKSGKPKGLQNFTKKDKSYHEFIYEIDSKTSMEQCQELTQQIAELTGFKPLQVAIHRDEVRDGKTHHHAHAVFFTLNKDGLQLARREASLHKGNLSKIQTLAAITLGMKRGENRYEQGIEQPNYIQDYHIYGQFKAQEKKLLAELKDKETELLAEIGEKKRLGELENEKERLRLKDYANELKRRENALNEKLADLELGHEKALRKLDISFNKRKSLLKNLLTFGKYNAKIEKDRQEARKALFSSFNELDDKAKNELLNLQNQIQRLNNQLKDKEKQQESLQQDYEKLQNNLETKDKQLNKQAQRLEYMQNRAKSIKEFCEKHLPAESYKTFKQEFYPQSLQKETSKQQTNQQGWQKD